MKIAILRGPRDLCIEEQPLKPGNLKPDEIRVKTEITALKIGIDWGLCAAWAVRSRVFLSATACCPVSRRLEPKRTGTHRLHYTEMVRAYEMALRREKSMPGVTFQWKEASSFRVS
ncbi:MAG: hypothetical protein DRP97_06670 [Candidatus Latescibacterota bacterium]|nr:MAG: hypothetical protein DRP97_06670 [Candidatus Latescibacterota bacterium]